MYVFNYSNNLFNYLLLGLFTQVCHFIILKTLNLYDASTCMSISDKHCLCLLQGTEYELLLLR